MDNVHLDKYKIISKSVSSPIILKAAISMPLIPSVISVYTTMCLEGMANVNTILKMSSHVVKVKILLQIFVNNVKRGSFYKMENVLVNQLLVAYLTI